ncbi:MAG: hypothetical protein ACRDT0_20100 [Pseudonocardiaceae bacterium]
MSQLNGVLASLLTGAVLVFYVELRVRSRTRRICSCDPIFRKLRNG